jgi:hypothetical protein
VVTNCQRAYYRGLEGAAAATARVDDEPRARAQAVHASFEPPDGPDLACRTGCDHCCRFPVGVRLAEALLLADAVSEDAALRARVLAEHAALASASWTDLVGSPCPLLRDGACSCYERRPMPCRALASRDADACARAVDGLDAAPRDEAGWWRGLGGAAALDQGLGPRELRAALAALLSLGAAPSRASVEAAFSGARDVPGDAP